MTRGLGTAAEAAIQQDSVATLTAVEVLFGSGPVRLVNGLSPILIEGAEYQPVGILGGVSVIAEKAELSSAGISLALSAIPPDVVAIAMAEPYQGRRVTVWEVILDLDTGLVVQAEIAFRGRANQMNIELGEQATIELTADDRLVDMDRPNVSRYTDEDQKRRFPGDRGFEFVAATADKDVVWPSRSFGT